MRFLFLHPYGCPFFVCAVFYHGFRFHWDTLYSSFRIIVVVDVITILLQFQINTTTAATVVIVASHHTRKQLNFAVAHNDLLTFCDEKKTIFFPQKQEELFTMISIWVNVYCYHHLLWSTTMYVKMKKLPYVVAISTHDVRSTCKCRIKLWWSNSTKKTLFSLVHTSFKIFFLLFFCRFNVMVSGKCEIKFEGLWPIFRGFDTHSWWLMRVRLLSHSYIVWMFV